MIFYETIIRNCHKAYNLYQAATVVYCDPWPMICDLTNDRVSLSPLVIGHSSLPKSAVEFSNTTRTSAVCQPLFKGYSPNRSLGEKPLTSLWQIFERRSHYTASRRPIRPSAWIMFWRLWSIGGLRFFNHINLSVLGYCITYSHLLVVISDSHFLWFPSSRHLYMQAVSKSSAQSIL